MGPPRAQDLLAAAARLHLAVLPADGADLDGVAAAAGGQRAGADPAALHDAGPDGGHLGGLHRQRRGRRHCRPRAAAHRLGHVRGGGRRHARRVALAGQARRDLGGVLRGGRAAHELHRRRRAGTRLPARRHAVGRDHRKQRLPGGAHVPHVPEPAALAGNVARPGARALARRGAGEEHLLQRGGAVPQLRRLRALRAGVVRRVPARRHRHGAHRHRADRRGRGGRRRGPHRQRADRGVDSFDPS
jgi:hypothetical protein